MFGESKSREFRQLGNHSRNIKIGFSLGRACSIPVPDFGLIFKESLGYIYSQPTQVTFDAETQHGTVFMLNVKLNDLNGAILLLDAILISLKHQDIVSEFNVRLSP